MNKFAGKKILLESLYLKYNAEKITICDARWPFTLFENHAKNHT